MGEFWKSPTSVLLICLGEWEKRLGREIARALGPVPVWESAWIVALVFQGILENMQEHPVPRHKVPRRVNLIATRERLTPKKPGVNTQIYIHEKPNPCEYKPSLQQVIVKNETSKFDTIELTIVSRRARAQGRNVGVASCWVEAGIMWSVSETLHGGVSMPA